MFINCHNKHIHAPAAGVNVTYISLLLERNEYEKNVFLVPWDNIFKINIAPTHHIHAFLALIKSFWFI